MTDILQVELEELAQRESDGICVLLLWDRRRDTLSVLVRDERRGEAFALEVEEGENALDLFYHPFAYAAFRGLEYGLPLADEALCA